MITEDYVSFETAKLLKEKGFNEACHTFYDSGHRHILKFVQNGLWNNTGVVANSGICVAPTFQMAMKWLREVHNIGVFPTTFYRHTKTFDGNNYGCTLVNLKTFDVIGNFEDCTFPADSYEQTCEAAIKYCLENLI